MLGLGTYGRAFRLSNPSQTNLGDPANGAGNAGQVIQSIANQ
jgi:hypothetical protein